MIQVKDDCFVVVVFRGSQVLQDQQGFQGCQDCKALRSVCGGSGYGMEASRVRELIIKPNLRHDAVRIYLKSNAFMTFSGLWSIIVKKADYRARMDETMSLLILLNSYYLQGPKGDRGDPGQKVKPSTHWGFSVFVLHLNKRLKCGMWFPGRGRTRRAQPPWASRTPRPTRTHHQPPGCEYSLNKCILPLCANLMRNEKQSDWLMAWSQHSLCLIFSCYLTIQMVPSTTQGCLKLRDSLWVSHRKGWVTYDVMFVSSQQKKTVFSSSCCWFVFAECDNLVLQLVHPAVSPHTHIASEEDRHMGETAWRWIIFSWDAAESDTWQN